MGKKPQCMDCSLLSQHRNPNGAPYCKKHFYDWQVRSLLEGGGGFDSWVCDTESCGQRVPFDKTTCHYCRKKKPTAPAPPPAPPSASPPPPPPLVSSSAASSSDDSVPTQSLEQPENGGGGGVPSLAPMAATTPDFTTTLIACHSKDDNIRTAAEAALKSAEQTDPAAFIIALANELATEGKDVTARQLAGLHLKNLLDEDRKDDASHEKWKWKSIPAEQRSFIKSAVIGAIRSPVPLAAQACAQIATIELPYQEWPEYLTILSGNVTSTSLDDGIKISSLECLGYACERLAWTLPMSAYASHNVSPETTNLILTTIVDGMQADKPNSIRFAATKALGNALPFTRKNMDTPTERNMIFQTICIAARSEDVLVREEAYKCIVDIAFMYYDKLQDYMQTLSQLTFATIRNATNCMKDTQGDNEVVSKEKFKVAQDEEKVAIHAIEFWAMLADKELELIESEKVLEVKGDSPSAESICRGYVEAALEHLCPLLINSLTTQDKAAEIEDDVKNLSIIGAICLEFVAGTVQDAIVAHVMPFVEQHIKSENWRFKEAAIAALKSILIGPSDEAISPYIDQLLPSLLAALSDSNDLVKDTTSWSIQRVCEYRVCCIPANTFTDLMDGLVAKLLSETPRISSHACSGIQLLAMALKDEDSAATFGTNRLTESTPQLFETLFQVVDREDASESDLRITAFKAIRELIQNDVPDVKKVLLQLLHLIINRLAESFNKPVSTIKDTGHNEFVQGQLCGLIQVISVKLSKEDLFPYCDTIMTNFIQVLQTTNAACHEEAFNAVSAVVNILEGDFGKYMIALQPFLMAGLHNSEAYTVCIAAVGLLGDICRATEAAVAPFLIEIMRALVEALANDSLDRRVKPPILSCLGDIALAVGAGYEPYLLISFSMLSQAGRVRVHDDNDDLIDFFNTLWECILEGYTGIVHGLRDKNRLDLILPCYIDEIFDFLKMVTENHMNDLDKQVLGIAVGLVGDIAGSFRGQIRTQIGAPYVMKLLTEGLATEDPKIVATCQWAQSLVQQVLAVD